MCGKNFAFLCCGLILLVTSSSKSQPNINKVRDDNLRVQFEVNTESRTIYTDEIKARRYDLYEKFTNNTQYETQNKLRTTSRNNDCKNVDSRQYKLDTRFIHNHENDEEIAIKSHANSINPKINFTLQETYKNLIEKNNSMSHEVFENFSNDNTESNIVPYEMCHNNICILLCCPLGDRLIDDKCISKKSKYLFPNVYEYTNDLIHSVNITVDELFQLSVYDSCLEKNHSVPSDGQYDYMIFANGSIYLSYYKIFTKLTSYCIAVMDRDTFEVIICSETLDEINNAVISQNDNATLNFDAIIHASLHVVTMLFLMPIFLVYSILPELQTVHGFMLRNYSGALSVAYMLRIVTIIIKANDIQYPICITIAFFDYFCFLSSYFWLTTISFDMWWTFRDRNK
ncbi:G-protein coupled receptor Mth2-like [Nylanderia fulva]|uniref:G-protein coupled receptor Mth2-like n=1 Tax=Nylanderia fulva TaxID=613905 RepID=UPI0010FAF3CC|nr:G-protein coupled receptor Mth2-like [Nylanderia fulva]